MQSYALADLVIIETLYTVQIISERLYAICNYHFDELAISQLHNFDAL